MSLNIRQYILTSIICLISSMNLNENVLFDREKNYIGLPNELPTLSGLGIISNDGTQESSTDYTSYRKKIYEIKNLVGALPIPEQIALLESMNSDYFNTTTLNELITKRSLYEKEYDNFLNYLEDYEKQLPYGLGCLQFTANRLVYNSKYNEDMNSILYGYIDEIISTHKKMIDLKKDLLDDVFPILLKNRQKLYNISSTPSCDSNDYTCDENDVVTGITFNSKQQKSIVSAFMESYLQNQIDYAAKLSNLIMLTEIAISNMDGCRDYDDSNHDAGESSTYVSNAKISYQRRNKKQKAINGNTRIGIENRTSNGYKIYKGYFSGGSRRHDEDTYINSYIPRELYSKFNDTLDSLSSSDTEKINFVNSFISNLQVYNVNSNIEDEVSTVFADASSNSELEYLSNYFNGSTLDVDKFIKHKCPSNYTVFCQSGTCNLYVNFSTSGSQISTLSDTNSISLYVCLKNDYPLGLRSDSSSYESLSGFGSAEKINYMLKMTNQGCFGVFTSGGRNDKDACRDVLKDKCGTELDYHCKKLGLYDYINANPSAANIPDVCKNYDSNKDDSTYISECFKWINTNFITSGLSLKPSALIGTNLLLQKKVSSNIISSTLKTGSDPSTSAFDFDFNPDNYSNNNFSFYTNYSDAFIYTFKYYMNKGNHFIMQNSGKYLSFELLFFFAISFFLL